MQNLPASFRYIAFAAVPIAVVIALFAIFRGGGSSSPGDGETADGGGTEMQFSIDRDRESAGVPIYNPDADADSPAEAAQGGTSDNDNVAPAANVRRSHAEDLRKGECINPIDNDGYAMVLPCSEARLQVIVVIEMPDSGWEGDEYLKEAADEYCPDETDFKYWPDEFDWALGGDRHVLCLADISQGDSGGFDGAGLAGRWNIPAASGYLDLGLDSIHEDSDGQIAVYKFDEFGANSFGLTRQTGSGEIIVYADGSAKISGTNDLLVFSCFNNGTYEGELNFTANEFFGSIWCEGDPSDPSEITGYRQ